MRRILSAFKLLLNGHKDAAHIDFMAHALPFTYTEGDQQVTMYVDQRRVQTTANDDGSITFTLIPEPFNFPWFNNLTPGQGPLPPPPPRPLRVLLLAIRASLEGEIASP